MSQGAWQFKDETWRVLCRDLHRQGCEDIAKRVARMAKEWNAVGQQEHEEGARNVSNENSDDGEGSD